MKSIESLKTVTSRTQRRRDLQMKKRPSILIQESISMPGVTQKKVIDSLAQGLIES